MQTIYQIKKGRIIMSIEEKTPQVPQKSQQEKQAILKRLEILVTETETLADAFEQIAKKRGVGV